MKGRTPHGVRGLKYIPKNAKGIYISRTPHGVRGLKSLQFINSAKDGTSHPARGAWIEIILGWLKFWLETVAPRTGCVD